MSYLAGRAGEQHLIRADLEGEAWLALWDVMLGVWLQRLVEFDAWCREHGR